MEIEEKIKIENNFIITKRKIDDVICVEDKTRRINKKTFLALKNNIANFGCLSPILINSFNNQIISGRKRYKCLQELDYKEIDTIEIYESNEEKQKLLGISFNRLTGEFNTKNIKEILDSIQDTESLEISGFSNKEINNIIFDSTKINSDLVSFDIETHSEQNLKILSRTKNKTIICIRQLKQETELSSIKNKKSAYLIAQELADILLSIFGNLEGFTIISAPKGKSFFNSGFHLCSYICEILAAKLGMNYLDAFEPSRRSSRGKNNKKLKEGIILPEKILLFDDIITTGSTITNCLEVLGNKFVIPIVWLNSDYRKLSKKVSED